jgi:spore germination cell wall hydrolase CwlJ-like protein
MFMPDSVTPGKFDVWQAYEFGLLPLLIYREARGQPEEAMAGVAWVAKNRAAHPRWWGDDIPSVILAHYQFSCGLHLASIGGLFLIRQAEQHITMTRA